MIRHLVLVLILSAVSACASMDPTRRQGIHLKDIEGSLAELRSAAVAALPVGNRAISPNGREIMGRHFLVSGNGNVRPAGDALERYYAQVVILGDRQPYDIEFYVIHEKRVLKGDNFIYVTDYYDTLLARDVSRKFEVELAKRREDRNIIDDFRVF
jgi:hypothetical protein